MTPPVRAAIARREADMHREITRHDELRNLGNDFARTANEFAPLIQQLGMAPPALFRQYLEIIRNIHQSDPQTRAVMFRDMALRNGADPRAFSGSPAGGPARPGAAPGAPNGAVQASLPPEVSQMAREWQAYKRQQEEYQQQQAEAERVRQEQEERETASEIDIFRSRPEHPHFEAVKDLMASLLRGGVAQTLEEAYQSAIWAHPQIRAQLEQERNNAAANAARARREVERARNKSGSVRGSRGSTPEAQTGSRGSVRDDIRAAMEAVGGGRV